MKSIKVYKIGGQEVTIKDIAERNHAAYSYARTMIQRYLQDPSSIDVEKLLNGTIKLGAKLVTEQGVEAIHGKVNYVEYNGRRWPFRELEIHLSLSTGSLCRRVRQYENGTISFKEYLTRPVRYKAKELVIDGRVYTTLDIVAKLNISTTTATQYMRQYERGERTVEQLFTKPNKVKSAEEKAIAQERERKTHRAKTSLTVRDQEYRERLRVHYLNCSCM